MFDSVFAMSGLSLERLRTFVLVADSDSIAHAAGRNAVRQSQFSRQIKELEEHFGVELVKRAGKTLVLTDAGEALARTAREQLGALEDFTRTCHSIPSTFHIGAGDTLLRWLVIPRLSLKHRLVLHTLGPRGVGQGLRDLTLDFGLAHALGGAKLGRIRYQLFVPRALAGKRDPDWIARHVPFAIAHGDEDWTESFGGLVEPALVVETFPQAWCALEGGRYAVILPDLAKPPPNTIVIDWPALHRLDRTIHLVWSERAMRLRPNAEAVRAWLKSALRF